MILPDALVARNGFVVTHSLTVRDRAKSRAFYAYVFGGNVAKPENPCHIQLSDAWIVLNSGGGPAPDEPEVILEAAGDPNRVNRFLNLRITDIQGCYGRWKAKGAHFLAEPLDTHGRPRQSSMPDPDGCLIEAGPYTQGLIEVFARCDA